MLRKEDLLVIRLIYWGFIFIRVNRLIQAI